MAKKFSWILLVVIQEACMTLEFDNWEEDCDDAGPNIICDADNM